jgi:hypothetical protein
VGIFELKDSKKYPQMCAKESINMTTGITYYRG